MLGHEPPPVIPNSNKSTFTRARIKYKWLDAQFAAPLAADADNEVVQQNAHYHLLVWIGGPVVHGKVGGPGPTIDSVALQPNQQCETVQLG